MTAGSLSLIMCAAFMDSALPLISHAPLLQSDSEAQAQAQARDETDEPRRRSVDNAELNQLARMMPDPAEDELFDNGTLFTQLLTANQDPNKDPRA